MSHYDDMHFNYCPYQVSTSYTLRFLKNKILKIKVNGKIKTTSSHCTPAPIIKAPSSTFLLRSYGPDKILKIKVTVGRSKVKSRSQHIFRHLHHRTNVPTVSEIQPGHTLSCGSPARKSRQQVKTILARPLKAVG